ncbi:VCBS repeat-containing protein [Caloranaerobacter azorensis]|uniref:VCBS repeat-containing protein n=1 Tax=Caloranaerobacter azorensis TaxID=116090 RepID=A0A6P1YDD7_9FIRM|nr:VCBS repeat-containing protein [Caloranaerobacter azorensis]QIB26932.1 VCBS repeat-containing protein [Caloranaerobacter azorensis]
MKKKLVKLMLVTSLIGASLFTGCGLNDAENLMEPPRLSISQEEVKTLVKDVLDSNAKLVSPRKGENNSAIQFVDLDNDKKDEVIVLYMLKNDKYPLRGLILKQQGDEWKIDDGIKGIGYNFDNILFKDITGDGKLEIVVSWNIGEEGINKGLSVYKYEDGKSVELFNDSYEAFAVDDLDNDKKSEIFLVKLNKDEIKAKGELYKYVDKEIKLVDEVKMDGAIGSHYSTKVGMASKDKKGIFLEATLGAHSSITELIVMENGKLKNVFYNEDTESVDKTFRSYGAISEDIDNDGIIEIPLLRAPITYEDASMAEIPWITSWYKWDGKDGLEFSGEGYFNILGGYYFKFPEKWNERITLDHKYPDENNGRDELMFSYVDNKNKKHRLFTIAVFDKKDWEKSSQKDGYVKFLEDTNKVYTVSIENNLTDAHAKEMSLSLEQIKDNFRIYKFNFQ